MTNPFWRLSGEFFVIVIGVLTALGVDQLMEVRREAVLERELLQSLTQDLRTDSADFASLPQLASRRAWGAEVLLREFAPGETRGFRVVEAIDTLGPYPSDVTDAQLVSAFAMVGIPTDLDVASGAYREFTGGQRLVRNPRLRESIHAYYASVESNLKFDPRVRDSMRELDRRSVELGLHSGDADAALVRQRLSRAGPSYFAALRTVQQDAVVQGDIADLLLSQAVALMADLAEELQRD
jgi:hypothetical protein